MRAYVSCQIDVAFAEPVRALTHVLRMKPRGFDSQHVQDWSVSVEPGAKLRRTEDAFGNVCHSLSHDGPLDRLTFHASGQVETSDAAGVVAGAIEKFPLDVFLRETEGARADAKIEAFVADALAGEADPLGRMHALMASLGKQCKFEPGGDAPPRAAAEVFAAGKGSAREIAQLFVACARAQRVPARFISGLYLGAEGAGDAAALHAWAEVHIAPYGWIAFDAALGFCPKGEHLRIAQGLDYWGAAPRRGAFFGYATESVAASVRVEQTRQASWQSQQ